MKKHKDFIAGIGKNTKGETITFEGDSSTGPYNIGLGISNRDLVELCLTDGITAANCRGNYLIELSIPKSMMYIECDPDLFDYKDYSTDDVLVEIYYTDEVTFEFE